MSQLTASLITFPSMTTYRGGCAAAVVKGKLCAVGGVGVRGRLDSIEIYDSGGRWTESPSKMCERRFGCAAATIGNSVYVAGGYGASSAEVFDVETGLWRSLPSMSTERYGCAAVAVGDEFFVFGGLWRNTAESYNIKMGLWEDLPPMNNSRWGCAAAVINNKIYVVGGYQHETYYETDDETDSVLDTVEVFDLTTRTWALLPHRMTTRRASCAAAAVGRYLVVAGGDDENECTLSTVEMYDVDTEMWKELPPMSTGRSGCAAVSLGGSVYVIGGQDGNRRFLDSVEIPFSKDVVKGMLVDWSGGSWRNDILPLLHMCTSIVHRLNINITSLPTLLGRVSQEARVQSLYEILRGEISVFKHTCGGQ